MSSFISNSKGLPRAALVAAAIVLCLEGAAAGALAAIGRTIGEDDLVRMDSDPLCRRFLAYNTDPPRDPRYRPMGKHRSVRELAQAGPYDVLTFGSSVTNTGWTEILRLDRGVRLCNLAANVNFDFLEDPTVVFAKTLEHREALGGRRPVLLYCDLAFVPLAEHVKHDDLAAVFTKAKVESGWEVVHFETPLLKLWRFFATKNRYGGTSDVLVVRLAGRDELFFRSHVEALWSEEPVEEGQAERLRRHLASLKRAADEKDCVFAIAMFPGKAHLYERALNEALGKERPPSPRWTLRAWEKAAAENGIPFLDIEKELAPAAAEAFAREGKLFWRRCDTHLNDEGNRQVATIVERFLARAKQATHS